MTAPPHFETAPSWSAARALVTFAPLEPPRAAGLRLRSLRVHVRDHKLRELPMGDRTLEAHYDGFVLSQARRGVDEARRLALDVSYGLEARPARILGREARVYEIGPEPPPDDLDGRSPAVVTWFDGEMFYMLASGTMSADELMSVATALYPP